MRVACSSAARGAILCAIAFAVAALLSSLVKAQHVERRAAPITLTELVAPISLYPDVLVGQILVAATHPADVVHAQVWVEAARPASAAELAQALDGKRWDPEVKALAMLPGVLDALKRNFHWTVALGEAYAAEPAEVLAAIQAVRRMAYAEGQLRSSSEQKVIVDGALIFIEPAVSARVYVSGGGSFDVGVFERFAWGWHGWQVRWKDGTVRYRQDPYLSQR